MKLLFTAALSVIIFYGCSNAKKDRVRAFIPGVYVSSYANEYTKGNDTLIIAVISKEGNNYRIDRFTTYQRIRNGKLLPKERKQERWLGIYNEQEKVLYEATTGKVLSFIPEKAELLIGDNEYYKIKS